MSVPRQLPYPGSKFIHDLAVLALLMVAAAGPTHANVVTDWDEKAMEVIQGNVPAPPPQIGPVGGLRIATIMHIANISGREYD